MFKSRLRPLHRLDNANSVGRFAVFLASPRYFTFVNPNLRLMTRNGCFTLARMRALVWSSLIGFLSVQQLAGQRDVVSVGRRGSGRMDKPRVRIDPGMGFHAEVPLVALLCLVHFRVTITRAVLGGAGCRNQGGIDHGALFEQ